MAHFLVEVPDAVTVVDGSAAFSRRREEPVTAEAIRAALTVNSYHSKAYFTDAGAVWVTLLTPGQVAALRDDVGF